MQGGNQSEVARLIERLDAEAMAMQQALYGFAEGSSRHAFINHKYQTLSAVVDELTREVGQSKAMEMALAAVNAAFEKNPADEKSGERK